MSQSPKQESSSKEPLTAKATSNQNSLLLAAGGALILITLAFSYRLSLESNKSTQANAIAERIERLQEAVSNKERELLAQGISLPSDSSAIDTLSQRISTDLAELSRLVSDFQISQSNVQSALASTESNLRAALATNQQLSSKIAQMEASAAQSDSYKKSALALQQQIATLQNQLLAQEKQILELSSRPTAEVVDQFRASLNDTRLVNEQLVKKIGDLEAAASQATAPAPISKIQEQIQESLPEDSELYIEQP